MTIKSAGVLPFSENGSDDDDSPKSHMTNHIDSSGYVGFSSEVAVELRITEGGMIIDDFIEGYAVQNQTMRCRVMANLFVYKVDRCTPELQMEPEGMHDRFRNEIENVLLSSLPTTVLSRPMRRSRQRRILLPSTAICTIPRKPFESPMRE